MESKHDAADDGDDDMTINVDEGRTTQGVGNGPASPLALHGLDLDLSLAARKTSGSDSHYTGIQEESLLVVFDLPDGSQGEAVVGSLS